MLDIGCLYAACGLRLSDGGSALDLAISFLVTEVPIGGKRIGGFREAGANSRHCGVAEAALPGRPGPCVVKQETR